MALICKDKEETLADFWVRFIWIWEDGNVPPEPPSAKSRRCYMTRSKGLLPLALPDTGIGESAGKRPAGTSVVSPSLLFAVGCVWCCLSGSGCRWWCCDALGQFCLCSGMGLCGDLLEVLLVLLAEDCFDPAVV
uniref:Uncharacterized protein n=1 Tax=Populus trichocarpa TaxID=3694 RepID=B9N0Z9_POPTR